MLELVDLDGWVVSFPTEDTILLSKATANFNSQIMLRERDPELYLNWGVVFYEHILFMDKLSGRNIEESFFSMEAQNINKLDDKITASNAELLSSACDQDSVDHFDRRGFRICDTANFTTQFSSNTNSSKLPELSPTYNELQEQMELLVKQHNNSSSNSSNGRSGGDADLLGERLVYLLHCMDNNQKFQEIREQETLFWKNIIEPYCQECLETTRTFIPPHIFSSTVTSLVNHHGIYPPLAQRIISKKCLWLVRISTEDISRIHIADLLHRFNPQAVGMDIVEVAAIYAVIPKQFQYDPDHAKQQWRGNVESLLKQMLAEFKEGTISDSRIRNPVYDQCGMKLGPFSKD